jgi:Type IV secretion-system coupling protein DNA-binding domain
MGGILAAHIMKYLFQKATERRIVNAQTRPVFLWVDECQYFLSEYDQEFQSTARSSRAATVYLTQNISGIYSSIGGMRPQDTTEALFGNLRTKIFHLNDNQATNQWAADMIGKQPMIRQNWGQNNSHGTSYSEGKNRGFSSSRGGGSSGSQSSSNYSYGSNYGTSTSHSKQQSHGNSHGTSEQMDYRLQPSFFAEGLRNGGQRNNCKVDAILVQSGKRFDGTGQHWGLCSFSQEIKHT